MCRRRRQSVQNGGVREGCLNGVYMEVIEGFCVYGRIVRIFGTLGTFIVEWGHKTWTLRCTTEGTGRTVSSSGLAVH